MRTVVTVVCCLASLALCGAAFAAGADAIGTVKTLQGHAVVQRGSAPLPAKIGMDILRNDTLVTGTDGALGILFTDNSTLSLGKNSKLHLSEYEFDVAGKKAGFTGRVRKGTMVYLSGLIAKMSPEAVKFRTPTAVAGIRGTKLAISVEGVDED